MTLYEAAKTLLFPAFTKWGSHSITIAVTGIAATTAASWVLRKLRHSEDSYRRLVEMSLEQFGFIAKAPSLSPTAPVPRGSALPVPMNSSESTCSTLRIQIIAKQYESGFKISLMTPILSAITNRSTYAWMEGKWTWRL
jgi:hypothetical protein